MHFFGDLFASPTLIRPERTATFLGFFRVSGSTATTQATGAVPRTRIEIAPVHSAEGIGANFGISATQALQGGIDLHLGDMRAVSIRLDSRECEVERSSLRIMAWVMLGALACSGLEGH